MNQIVDEKCVNSIEKIDKLTQYNLFEFHNESSP